MSLYDINGGIIENTGGSSDFSVTDFKTFVDGSGSLSRQGVLTYQGKKFYPVNFIEQQKQVVKDYGEGIMLTLGDSYTTYMKTLFDDFAKKHNLVQDNRGLPSSTIAGDQAGNVGFKPFWIRLDEAISEYEKGKTINGKTYYLNDIKLIHFMGGANDWSTVNAEVNRLGCGPQDTNKETLYGACNYIFSKFLSVFPNADVIITIQPVNYANVLPDSEQNAKDVGFDSLSQAKQMTDTQYSSYLMMRKGKIVKEMAERYGLPINDCCFEWYNPQRKNEAKKYWRADKLHLTDEGHNAVIKSLEKKLNNLKLYRI